MSDRKEYLRNWRMLNKERIKQHNIAYYENNREEILEKSKIFLQSDKGKKKRIEWRTSPSGMKSNRISNWKQRGVKCDDFDALYEKYLNTKNCENCDVELCDDVKINGNSKCLDHDHETGVFRNVLCNYCNVKRR